tara:strand:- start:95 stop:871 length:777 start_codon:yes stop_codon:yes gene_type:complete
MPMYYMLLCYLSGISFIGTPQGSEILVRPRRSLLYKYFCKKVLKSAKIITVDSKNMSEEIFKISKKNSLIVQNGIEVDEIIKFENNNTSKKEILSIRGMTDLYNIDKIIDARNYLDEKLPLNFIYPFSDEEYLLKIKSKKNIKDKMLGRLNKRDMISKMKNSFLVISIPKSDSSPRSVYESIFSGACVAVNPNKFIDDLPKCMKERLFVVDLNDKFWLKKAIKYGQEITRYEYNPSQEALNMFDQNISMQKVIDTIYK